MNWKVAQGDILELEAEVLVVSANPQLNLSGGVGAALRMRYGNELQNQLHDILSERNVQYVPAGEAVVTHPENCPYHAIIHAVGIDVFYETSANMIAQAIATSLDQAKALNASSVAMAAIGTGYGNLPIANFARGIVCLSMKEYEDFEQITICLRKESKAMKLAELLNVDLIEI